MPADDAEALAAAITRLLSSRALRCEHGRSARASVLARYNLPRLFADIDRLYRSLVA